MTRRQSLPREGETVLLEMPQQQRNTMTKQKEIEGSVEQKMLQPLQRVVQGGQDKSGEHDDEKQLLQQRPAKEETQKLMQQYNTVALAPEIFIDAAPVPMSCGPSQASYHNCSGSPRANPCSTTVGTATPTSTTRYKLESPSGKDKSSHSATRRTNATHKMSITREGSGPHNATDSSIGSVLNPNTTTNGTVSRQVGSTGSNSSVNSSSSNGVPREITDTSRGSSSSTDNGSQLIEVESESSSRSPASFSGEDRSSRPQHRADDVTTNCNGALLQRPDLLEKHSSVSPATSSDSSTTCIGCSSTSANRCEDGGRTSRTPMLNSGETSMRAGPAARVAGGRRVTAIRPPAHGSTTEIEEATTVPAASLPPPPSDAWAATMPILQLRVDPVTGDVLLADEILPSGRQQEGSRSPLPSDEKPRPAIFPAPSAETLASPGAAEECSLVSSPGASEGSPRSLHQSPRDSSSGLRCSSWQMGSTPARSSGSDSLSSVSSSSSSTYINGVSNSSSTCSNNVRNNSSIMNSATPRGMQHRRRQEEERSAALLRYRLGSELAAASAAASAYDGAHAAAGREAYAAAVRRAERDRAAGHAATGSTGRTTGNDSNRQLVSLGGESSRPRVVEHDTYTETQYGGVCEEHSSIAADRKGKKAGRDRQGLTWGEKIAHDGSWKERWMQQVIVEEETGNHMQRLTQMEKSLQQRQQQQCDVSAHWRPSERVRGIPTSPVTAGGDAVERRRIRRRLFGQAQGVNTMRRERWTARWEETEGRGRVVEKAVQEFGEHGEVLQEWMEITEENMRTGERSVRKRGEDYRGRGEASFAVRSWIHNIRRGKTQRKEEDRDVGGDRFFSDIATADGAVNGQTYAVEGGRDVATATIATTTETATTTTSTIPTASSITRAASKGAHETANRGGTPSLVQRRHTVLSTAAPVSPVFPCHVLTTIEEAERGPCSVADATDVLPPHIERGKQKGTVQASQAHDRYRWKDEGDNKEEAKDNEENAEEDDEEEEVIEETVNGVTRGQSRRLNIVSGREEHAVWYKRVSATNGNHRPATNGLGNTRNKAEEQEAESWQDTWVEDPRDGEKWGRKSGINTRGERWGETWREEQSKGIREVRRWAETSDGQRQWGENMRFERAAAGVADVNEEAHERWEVEHRDGSYVSFTDRWWLQPQYHNSWGEKKKVYYSVVPAVKEDGKRSGNNDSSTSTPSGTDSNSTISSTSLSTRVDIDETLQHQQHHDIMYEEVEETNEAWYDNGKEKAVDEWTTKLTVISRREAEKPLTPGTQLSESDTKGSPLSGRRLLNEVKSGRKHTHRYEDGMRWGETWHETREPDTSFPYTPTSSSCTSAPPSSSSSSLSNASSLSAPSDFSLSVSAVRPLQQRLSSVSIIAGSPHVTREKQVAKNEANEHQESVTDSSESTSTPLERVILVPHRSSGAGEALRHEMRPATLVSPPLQLTSRSIDVWWREAHGNAWGEKTTFPQPSSQGMEEKERVSSNRSTSPKGRKQEHSFDAIESVPTDASATCQRRLTIRFTDQKRGTEEREKWYDNGFERQVDRWRVEADGSAHGEKVGSKADGTEWRERWGRGPDYTSSSSSSNMNSESNGCDEATVSNAGSSWFDKSWKERREPTEGNCGGWWQWGETAGNEGQKRWEQRWWKNEYNDGAGKDFVEKWEDDGHGNSRTIKTGSSWREERSGQRAVTSWFEDSYGQVQQAHEKWAYKRGCNEEGDVWLEKWNNKPHENTAEKQGSNAHGDNWREQWKETFNENGNKTETWAEKAGSNARGDSWYETWQERGCWWKTALKEGRSGSTGEHWVEKWGEDMQQNGAGEKWCEKYACNSNGSRHGCSWGNRWGPGEAGGHAWGEEWTDDYVHKWWHDTPGRPAGC